MEETIPATGHNYGSWELTANGDGIRVCQNPDCDEYEECDHSREEPYQKVVSANDCIPVDYEATFCSVCGLNISDEQLSYITNAQSGCGLIKYGGNIVPFINRFPKNTLLYKLMSTKPSEKNK